MGYKSKIFGKIDSLRYFDTTQSIRDPGISWIGSPVSGHRIWTKGRKLILKFEANFLVETVETRLGLHIFQSVGNSMILDLSFYDEVRLALYDPVCSDGTR